jgi:hypothetical protein
VVVCDFDIIGVSILPEKANTPLIIDPNAVLSGSVASKLFQMVCRWNSEVIEYFGVVEHAQFAQGYLLDVIRQSSR